MKNMLSKNRLNRGFTLVEIIIVMSVIAILLAAAIPAFQGMLQEGDLSKVDAELQTLKTAVISYKRHHGKYPTDIATTLTTASPRLINEILEDPFRTNSATTPNTYGYITATDTTFGEYFIIFSQSVDAVVSTSWDSSADSVKIVTDKDDVAVSNAPIN